MTHTASPSPFLPFAQPDIGEEEIAEVVDTLRSGWVTTGAKTQRLEKDFAARIGVPSALALSSGTAALHIALRVCGVQPGDDVIVPTYTFTATGSPISARGRSWSTWTRAPAT
jgi:dTDP-4-amino-4,6-dideoxygalactose transaminase